MAKQRKSKARAINIAAQLAELLSQDTGKGNEALREVADRYFRAHRQGERGYKRADAILTEIAKILKPGEAIPLNENGRRAVLVDQFLEKDGKTPKVIVWNPCAARRFKLEIVEA
jgi:hypothetical protein